MKMRDRGRIYVPRANCEFGVNGGGGHGTECQGPSVCGEGGERCILVASVKSLPPERVIFGHCGRAVSEEKVLKPRRN